MRLEGRLKFHVERPSPVEVERWRTVVTPLVTLERVMQWGRAQEPPCPILEIVTQDEYTHDVVLRPAADVYLAFDTT